MIHPSPSSHRVGEVGATSTGLSANIAHSDRMPRLHDPGCGQLRARTSRRRDDGPMRSTPARQPIPQGAAIRTSEHAAFGTTRARLRAQQVQHPFFGVSAVGLDVASIVDACNAYEPLLRPGEAFSHTTAALLHGAPLPQSAAAIRPLHVLSSTTTRARTSGTRGHRAASSFPISFLHGLPVVTVETMWMQLASVLTAEDLTAVGDFLISGAVRSRRNGEPPLSDLASLAAAIRTHPRVRGVASARWALARLRTGVDSRMETLVRLLLVAGGLPEPLIGVAVPVADGSIVLHPDLAYPDLRIAIEYEGDDHRDAGRWQRDIERRELFEDAGWRVIRLTSRAVFHEPQRLIARVRRACEAKRDPGTQ
jgi:Protein of unknown function (DUF559)